METNAFISLNEIQHQFFHSEAILTIMIQCKGTVSFSGISNKQKLNGEKQVLIMLSIFCLFPMFVRRALCIDYVNSPFLYPYVLQRMGNNPCEEIE